MRISDVPSIKVAAKPVPAKRPTKGSKPPGEINVPAAFVPPPNPYVCSVTLPLDVRIRVNASVSSGVANVPVFDIVPARLNVPKRRRRQTMATFLVMGRMLNSMSDSRMVSLNNG